ncbi:hypothetical protein A3D71_03510 [Candidatus Kaiserbacteria bacterium RIFCSPHIGHO2_02_FULL_55_20]|uniref:Uncharacterized protein n=1 Tax=Candidatus Kaiserbacteria bacterium RIFCSPHIGHO2_02_FULL_55_20 TaxID=1798497 RepID=A0A1F6DV36_9BACT|nr:MAG: hypothetical protein A2680_04325 [Candidatus Kaiserbacteria bacterium RIFCSPHIGHO2_01_FULL_55_37]OGG65281.1 MAG: hypothetical protein A3D71_03510 [Candidatus Kaiserbacteria bacterium RIFCSPHIGHO2_02_FULL_55_20]
MSDLFFSSRLDKNWRWWAVQQTFIVLVVAILVGFAISLVIDLFALAVVILGVCGWFRYGWRYTWVNALLIAVGCGLGFVGVYVAIYANPLALTTTAAGFVVVLRFFSEGPERATTVTAPVEKVTKKTKKKKKPPPK